MARAPSSQHYHAIVDMGSNGIRFSITDLSPQTSRVMPTIYQDRVGISLYDAQWSTGTKQPIPASTIDAVIRALLRFKWTCAEYAVPESNIKILATEATRQAINSEDYRVAIKQATGWTVDMLPKEEEGRVGAMGVVSSFSTVKGLMMDLGGGSTQITWLVAERGVVRMSVAGSVSLPYGAAALMRRLGESQKIGGKALRDLKEEITSALKQAVEQIEIQRELLFNKEGLTLYLSGGGFRGWGFLLMSEHLVSPYPIPIINGFSTSILTFRDVSAAQSTAASDEDVFRVSERRAGQVPAVALLVGCMLDALPSISTVRFAQGGVREGYLYSMLSSEVKAEYPLVTGTTPFTTPSTPALLTLLHAAIPPTACPIPHPLITSLAHTLYTHTTLNKDLKSAAALRSTTTGILAGIHGASHDERAALAVMLCERWGGLGDLPPGEAGFYQRLLRLLGAEWAWWCLFFGRVAGLVGAVFPSGVVRDPSSLSISTSWMDKSASEDLEAGQFGLPAKQKQRDKGRSKKDKKHKKDKSSSSDESSKKNNKQILKIVFDFGNDEDEHLRSDAVVKALRGVEKLGKKKNWPDREGWGCRVDVRVRGGDGRFDNAPGDED